MEKRRNVLVQFIVDEDIYYEMNVNLEKGVLYWPIPPSKTGYMFNGWFFDNESFNEICTAETLYEFACNLCSYEMYVLKAYPQWKRIDEEEEEEEEEEEVQELVLYKRDDGILMEEDEDEDEEKHNKKIVKMDEKMASEVIFEENQYGYVIWIRIPYGRTYIGYNEFKNFRMLKHIEIPATVKTICRNALAGCEGLRSAIYGGSKDDLYIGDGNGFLKKNLTFKKKQSVLEL